MIASSLGIFRYQRRKCVEIKIDENKTLENINYSSFAYTLTAVFTASELRGFSLYIKRSTQLEILNIDDKLIRQKFPVIFAIDRNGKLASLVATISSCSYVSCRFGNN